MKSLAAFEKRKDIDEEEDKERAKRELFFEAHAVAPSPSRDYYVLKAYQKHFLYTWWKITHGPHYPPPIQKIVTLQEFSKDLTMQSELINIFGQRTTDLLHDIANEQWLLSTMPSSILYKIISFLSVYEILTLSKVCTRLYKECSSNELWQGLCRKHWKLLTVNDQEKASLIGWKGLYFEKMTRSKPSQSHGKSSALWTRVSSVATLPILGSRSSAKSNLTIRTRNQELKKTESLQSTSEIFKAASSSTAGKSTDRKPKGKTYRHPDWTTNSNGKLGFTSRSDLEGKYSRQPSISIINLVSSAENPKEFSMTIESPRMPKRKFTSIRTRPLSSKLVELPNVRSNKPILERTTRKFL